MRKKIIQSLSKTLVDKTKQDISLIAITGFDASGKTSLTKELEEVLKTTTERPVIKMSIDDFYNPQSMWKKKGADRALAWYQHGYNYTSLIENTLRPIKEACAQGKAANVPTKLFDRLKDIPLPPATENIPDNAIVLFDGIFLFRPVLKDFWDASIFVHASIEALLQRGLVRDTGRIGTPEQVFAAYRDTYIGAHRFYMRESRPYEMADIVIDNQDINQPSLCEENRRIELDSLLHAELQDLPSWIYSS